MNHPNPSADPDGSPELSLLFGAYLHQDWTAEYETTWDAVRDFCSNESTGALRRAADQAHRLIKSEPDDARLGDATERLHNYYHPPADGLTYHEWLRQLEAFLRSEADARG